VKEISLSVNRTLGTVVLTPGAFSPNGDGRLDRLAVTFGLTAPADVRLRIERDGRWVATPVTGSLQTGLQRLAWDGSRSDGRLRDGEYRAVVEATTAAGTIAYGVPFFVDTTAPRVRILPTRGLRIEVSEPATLTLVVDGRALRRDVRRAGIVRIPWAGTPRRARVVAWDAAGNTSGPVTRISRT
jgi:hypothetical protein